MTSISSQGLFSSASSEFQIRALQKVNPNNFTQTVLQISDQQSRDKNYEKSLEYIRTYIASLQAKLNTVIEELNNSYESMLSDVMFKRADTKDTAKLLNKIPNADVDTCAAASIGDPNALDITPYSKNIHNYQYNPLFASKGLDMSNYSNLGVNNSVASTRGYYQDQDGSHHELGSSFNTLNYLWMWDLDRINATYATTSSGFVDDGGVLHLPPGDSKINGTTIIADAQLTLAPGSDTNALQVNVTALQPNRGVFKPESESLHVERKTLLELNGEPTVESPDPLAGWITSYDHSGSNKRGLGLGTPWEGLNQWGLDTDTPYVHDGIASLHFGNNVTYDTHELDLVNGGFKTTGTINTQSGYLFEPELVREDFNGKSVTSLTAQGWIIGDATQVSISGVGAAGQVGDAVSGDALDIHYTGGVNGPGGSVTVSTPSFNLSEFDSTQLSSQSYYDIRGTLHGPGCIHPSAVVQVSAGGVTNTQLPNTPGRDVWSNGVFQTFNTNPIGAGSTSIDFNLVQKYADGRANPTHWQIDDVFLKAKGWSKGEMISPAMDFTGFDNAYVDYWDKIQTDTNNDKKEVYYSADYNDVTGAGTWTLLSTANGIGLRDWTNNKIEIPVGCLPDKSKIRIKFSFDTVNSQSNANLKGWNLDDIKVYGDKPEKTDFYYYRQGIDTEFVAGDGTSPTLPQNITSILTGWSSGTGSPQVTFTPSGSTSLNFSSSSVANIPVAVPPATVSLAASNIVGSSLTTSVSSNSFTMKSTSLSSVDNDTFATESNVMDLSNAATATLTFQHYGQHATTSTAPGLGNGRQVQVSIDGGSTWNTLPIGSTFGELDFASAGSPDSVSISLPVGNANTKIRFFGESNPIDTLTNNFWKVNNIAVSTTQSPGVTKTVTREGISNTINSSLYPGAKMSFDYTTTAPVGATNIRRELFISANGSSFSSLGTYNLSSGSVTGISVPRSTNLKYKFVTSFDIPANVTVPADPSIWNVNNLKIESSATDGFNIKEGYNVGQVGSNTNRPNISFDSRESNIEGRYKIPSGGSYTTLDSRTQITNTDFPMFANTLLSYAEQDTGIYNRAKQNSFAAWQGVTNVFPSEAIDILSKTKRANVGTYVANDLKQLLTYNKDGDQASQYMDDALAINYGLLTKPLPTVAEIKKDNTGWVNYSTSNNWFPYVAGTKYEEGGSDYKNMSIWGKKSFIIDTVPPATPLMVSMTSDDDSYMYVNGFIVPPTAWVTYYNTSYQSWYNGAYTTWYNTNIQPYLVGNPAIPPFNSNPYDPTRNPYDSNPPKFIFKLINTAPTPPTPPTVPTAPPLYTNVNTQSFDVSPFISKGFNTIAFKATEDHGAQGVTLSGTIVGANIATDSTWAVKLQPYGYDGTLQTGSANLPAKRLNSGQIIDLFKTDDPDKEQLNVNFANLDKNGVGILSKIDSVDVTVRGESTIQTFGTTNYSTKNRTTDGKMVAQLKYGYIDGINYGGDAGSVIFNPTSINPVTNTAITDLGLKFTTALDGKANISLFFDKTDDIVNDATVLTKVEYYEDSNQDGILDATELSTVNRKTKYLGLQDLRSNTAINPDSDVADASLSGQGVVNRYAKDASGKLLYNTSFAASAAVYDNYLVAGKGRTGGANVDGSQNKLTNKLKQLIDSDDFQEVLRFGLLDNIYLAAVSNDSRGDQVTGKLILDWDWRKRRVSIKQGSFSAVYKS
ncbi:MAG: hypothetical protein H7263_01910 [Candidatus Sericytochromatia bacterium]|nr:hypothetical protein [Candidatus Sericytochromatia bacterium]